MSTERTLYTLRVELIGTEPVIWRLIEVDGTLPLDYFHTVLQAAMGWTNSHLHSFMDRNPFEQRRGGLAIAARTWFTRDSLEEGLEGFDEETETVSGALGAGGGRLWYEYDFGDSWVHAIEQVSTRAVPTCTVPTDGTVREGSARPDPARVAGEAAESARVLDGSRRAPLEDCGGIGGWAELLTQWEGPTGDAERDEDRDSLMAWISGMQGFGREFDPADFSVDAANSDLRISLAEDRDTEIDALPRGAVANGHRADRWLAGLDGWCRHEFGAALHRAGGHPPGAPRSAELPVEASDAVVPYQWLIRACTAEGLALTATGNLSQAGVARALDELGWRGEDSVYRGGRTEANAGIVSMLRTSAIGAGLVRKSGKKLEATATGRKFVDDPAKLWQRLAERAIPARAAADEVDASMLELLVIAEGTASRRGVLAAVRRGMGMRGYVRADGGPLDERTFFRHVEQLYCTGYVLAAGSRPTNGRERSLNEDPFTPIERAFALAVLQA